MFIGFLLRNWQLVVMGMLLTIIGTGAVYVRILKSDIAVLESEKQSLTAKLEISNASIVALEESVNEQNIAVEKFKEDADLREKASRAEITKAKAESEKQKKRAEDIMGKKIPQNVTACDAANQLFNEEIKNGK